MNFKPIDEMSLRQLFSSEYAKEILKFSYIGPVLNPTGGIDPSPDALVLDMRKSPYKPLRCEFKYIPQSKDDFGHNGKFDIAIVWSIKSPLTKQKLLTELLEQNGCHEVIVLDETSKFHKLPEYNIENISRNFNIESLKQDILKFSLAPIVALYIAAKIFPNRFNMERMLEFLSKKFPSVASMQPQGRSNVVSAWLQTRVPLIKKAYGKSYEWNSDFDSLIASSLLSEWITVNYRGELPSEDDINSVVDQ